MMKKSLQNLSSFDSLYQGVIGRIFGEIKDSRASNAHYDILDILRCGFAIYSLKCASLFSFRKRSKAEESNLGSIYGINKVASDNTLRNVLDSVDPEKLRKGFYSLYKRIKKIGILKQYIYWRKHIVVSIDGVEHFCSKNISCDHCMTRKHRDGSQSNYHAMLSAAIVHPDKSEVFILDNEPIVKQDGSTKNDCERNAAKRLFSWFSEHYENEKFIFVEDALYANAPHLRQILKNKWEFVVNIKPKSHKKLFTLFETRKQMKSAKFHEFIDKKGTIHRFWYDNNLPLNGTATDLRVGVLMYEEEKKNGQIQKFSWATSFNLTKRNVEKIMRIGRSRWKIENETFNTLKNQGYHFDHNYGHGFQHLNTFLAYLMLLAFQTDQIFQRCNKLFNRIWEKAKTKAKLWEILRSVFMVKTIYSFNELFETLALQFRVQLE